MPTHPLKIAELLKRARKARDEYARLRVALVEIAVNEFGIDQTRAPQVCESFFDGYLTAHGHVPPHRKKKDQGNDDDRFNR